MKKNKIVLLGFLLLTNVITIFVFEIKITLLEATIINMYLFSLMLLTDFLWIQITKIKKPYLTHFFVLNFTRIVLSIIFLLPHILNYEKENAAYIINFFIIYFFHLIYEIKIKAKNSLKVNS